jgi:NAD(P)-dependent dehydrogenase (short-subunit alcohol dehydrogenase family)
MLITLICSRNASPVGSDHGTTLTTERRALDVHHAGRQEAISHWGTFTRPVDGIAADGVSEAALNFTCGLAAEPADDNIPVNAVSPVNVAARLACGMAYLSPEEAADTFVGPATPPGAELAGGLLHRREPKLW